MLCPIKVNSKTIELTVHTSCYCVLDLLCVNVPRWMDGWMDVKTVLRIELCPFI